MVAVRIVPANNARRSATIVNQGTVDIYLTPHDTTEPSTACLLIPGAGRSIPTSADIWAFAPGASASDPAALDVQIDYL